MSPIDDERQTRLAKNEDFFRKANEMVAGESMFDGECDLICECSARGCMVRISLTRSEYEHVRARGDRFVVFPGHENLEVEIVVESNPQFRIVEKRGRAGVVARAEDPR
jgi:hypothetical protein